MEVDVTATSLGAYESLSQSLRYPDDTYREHLARCAALLRETDSEAARRIEHFTEHIHGLSVVRLQELFTQTFDLSPLCSLEVGWQLYGEEYARGNFMVAMRSLLRDHDIPESSELPDHLTHVLPLLDRLEPDEQTEFIQQYVSPALTKMLKSFDGNDSPYEDVMRAIEDLLTHTPHAEATEVAHG